VIGKNKYYSCPLLPQLFGILTSGVENEKFKQQYDKVINQRKCLPALQNSKLPPMSPAGKKAGRKFANFAKSKELVDNELIKAGRAEKIAMILTLKDQIASDEKSSDPITDIQMPLLEREEAKRLAFEMFRANLEQFGKRQKNLHVFYTLGAGSGSGKSRICEEMKVWCDDFVSKQSEVCAVLIADSYIYFVKLD